MDAFGNVALRAVELVRTGTFKSAAEAWSAAAREAFPHSESMREKSCPRATFLGLCEEGMVIGVAAGTYTRSRDNKAYAVLAAALLTRHPELAANTPRALWDRVLGGGVKRYNSQMDVVLALHRRGMLQRGRGR